MKVISGVEKSSDRDWCSQVKRKSVIIDYLIVDMWGRTSFIVGLIYKILYLVQFYWSRLNIIHPRLVIDPSQESIARCNVSTLQDTAAHLIIKIMFLPP